MGNKTAHLVNVLLILVVIFIAYSGSFNSPFHFDDYSSIITNYQIKDMRNIPDFFYYDGAPLTGRPVTMATFAVNYKIAGVESSGYHRLNFFIHFANAVFVYALLFLTLKNKVNAYINTPFFASLMFAVHPIQTQAVTYIAQRAEILSAFFYLLCILLFRMGFERRHGWIYWSGALFSAVLAMGSKEIAVTLPVTILLYDFSFLSDGSLKALLKRWRIHALFFLTLLSLLYFMGLSQLSGFVSTNAVHAPPTAGIYAEIPSISRYEYMLTQFRVIWTYIRLLILPVNQNLDYAYPASKSLLNPLVTLPAFIGIIGLLVSALVFFKRQKVISFFIFWFFIMLAPTSSVFVLPDVIFEHRMYLASLGYFIILAIGVFRASDFMHGFIARKKDI